MCICSAHVCVHTHITYYSSCSLLGLTLSAKPQTTRSVHYTITALCIRVYIYMDVYMCMCVCVRREMKNTTLIRCLQLSGKLWKEQGDKLYYSESALY